MNPKVWLLFILGSLGAAQAAAPVNKLTVVIANGPLAGTYIPQQNIVACMHSVARKTFSVGFKDFDAHAAGVLSEGGLDVKNADRPGPQHGQVLLRFGDPEKHPVSYEIADAPLTLTVAGKTTTVSFDGKSDSNVKIKISVVCVDVTEV